MTQSGARRPDGRRERTSAAIADAASRLFFRQGVQRTTVDEIALEAGVSVGSIYVHFGSKETLYLRLVEKALDVNEQYVLARRWASSPLQRLLNVGDAYLDFAFEQPAAFRLIAMRERSVGVAPDVAEIESHIDDRIEQIIGLTLADAIAAFKAGEIASLPPENVMVYLWGSWSGVISLSLREDRLRVEEDVIRETLRLAAGVLIRGLGGNVPEVVEPAADDQQTPAASS